MIGERSAIRAPGLLALALLAPAGAAAARSPPAAPTEERLGRFEEQVEEFRQRLEIPGLSAVVLQDQEVIWERGFGFADLESRVPATPDTLHSIASLTKTFAATLILRLVERGELGLDEPISRYSSDFQGDSVRIEHLLSHTSRGAPGERFQYDGGRFHYLTRVIERKTGESFLEVMVETFLDPLGMSGSAPYHDVVDDADRWVASLGEDHLDRYAENLTRLARPYTYREGKIVPSTYPSTGYLGAAAGLLSTARDLARYDVALDRHVFLRQETQELAWTPFVSTSGQRLPYGLGWFVADWHGVKLVWHYGNWGTGSSAMHVKVPQRNVSVIMLVNSEALAAHGGDAVADNVFVCSFLRLWGLEHDCEEGARAALARWIEPRRAKGR